MNKTFTYYLVFTFIILAVSDLNAQITKDSTSNKVGLEGTSWFIFPFIYYTPETDWAFGAGGNVLFKIDPNSNPTNISASGYYTINDQFSLGATADIYIDNNKKLYNLIFNFSNEFDYFYGIGPSSPDIQNNKYLQKNILFDLKYQMEVFDDRFKIGGQYYFRNMTVLDKMNNPFLVKDTTSSGDGGVTSGLGFLVNWDSRDNILSPSTGGYYQFNATFYSNTFGSDFDFNQYIFDFRRYLTITLDHVFAIQSFYQFDTGSPPFFNLPLLGGSTNMRGYIRGRYRDKHYYNLQVEYRISHLIWKFGIIVFGGVGDVAPEFGKFTISTIKPTYGFGLRFRLEELEKLDLKMDIGWGDNSSGIYFGINQAF